jgi:predicted transcriptional regulator
VRGGKLDERLLVTLQEIAQITGLSRRSVSDALGMLEEFGLIRKSASTPTHPTFQFEMRPVRVPRLTVGPTVPLRVGSNEKRRI